MFDTHQDGHQWEVAAAGRAERCAAATADATPTRVAAAGTPANEGIKRGTPSSQETSAQDRHSTYIS